MNRRSLLRHLGLAGGAVVLGTWALAPLGCRRVEAPAADDGPAIEPLERDASYWRERLPDDRFGVLFRERTEPPFSSPLDGEWRDGTYICAACYLPLFTSADKFDSGTGWPSFIRPLPGAMGTRTDYKLILPRTEYHCIRCGGHQGHVFDDGPEPTGQRWCNNGLALEFRPEGEDLPALRG